MAKMTKDPNSVATTTVRNLRLVNALTVKGWLVSAMRSAIWVHPRVYARFAWRNLDKDGRQRPRTSRSA